MKKKTLALLFLIIVSDSIYLTNVVNRYTIESTVEYLFIFLYFFAIGVIVVYIINYFWIEMKAHSWKANIMLLLVLSVIIVGAGGGLFDNHKYQSSHIEVNAIGENNENSKGSEVWLTKVSVDGSEMDLTELQSQEWEVRDGALLSYKEQPSTVIIDFPAARDITISFLQHEWSGAVKIKDGDNNELFDLYSDEVNTMQYTVKSNIAPESIYSKVDFLMAVILVYSLIVCIFLLGRKNSVWFGLGLASIYAIVFIYTRIFNINKFIDLFLILASVVNGIVLSNFVKNNKKAAIKNKFQLYSLIVIAMIISYAIAGNSLFFRTGSVEFSLEAVFCYLLVFLWTISFEIVFIFIIEKAINKWK